MKKIFIVKNSLPENRLDTANDEKPSRIAFGIELKKKFLKAFSSFFFGFWFDFTNFLFKKALLSQKAFPNRTEDRIKCSVNTDISSDFALKNQKMIVFFVFLIGF